MKQYYTIKAVHPDAILLFRVGDFYETFGDDAIKASGILGITLTRRATAPPPTSSWPDSRTMPSTPTCRNWFGPASGLRSASSWRTRNWSRSWSSGGVIELVTPGIVMGDNILANKENNYIASVCFGRRTTGVAFLDISTGEFYVAEGYGQLCGQAYLEPPAERR